ncbi:MAG: DEAD/DEAH box helicase, partial [Bacteroidetes bacterium]
TTLRENVLPAVRIGEDQLKQARSDIERLHYPNLQELANSYQGKSLRIEPTFYSDRYGMQGRLDALIEYPEDPERRDVFELKSGKEPRGHVAPSHKVQVLCYDMLLRSVFSTKRKGNSAIFYSQAASQPLRNVTATRQEEQRLIYLRNRLVSDLFRLTDRNFRLLGDIHPEHFGPRIIYKEAQILQFQEQYDSASLLEKAYFEEFAAFVLRELRTAKIGDGEENEKAFKGFSALWLDGRETKESSLICGLRFVGADEALETLIFTRDEGEAQATDFREGDIAIIYPQDTNGLFPLRYQILKCSIEKLTDKELHLRLRNRQSDVKALFRRHQQWALEHDLLESNYHELLRSLYQFLSAPERQRKRVLGEVRPAFDPVLPQITDDSGFGGTHNLSPHQREIIRRALAARDFFLIQGPPGTGKTSTILTRIVGHLYRHSEEGIMVLAFTNRAVDEICEKLHSSGVHFLRIGGTRSPFTLQAQTRELNFVQTGKLLRETRVYVATISSFLSRQQELLRIRSFDTLIVDEASQLLEPHLAGPLTQFSRYILIGDQNQLPAVAQQKAASCRNLRPELESAGFADLRTSLFERLWNRCQQQGWHDATGMLEEHYRMHTDVADLINPYYKGKLLCLSPRQKDPLAFPENPLSPLAELISQHRVLFIESSAVIADKVHGEEAERVIALIAALKELYGDTFDPEKTVGVITPWRKQISQIRAQLPIEFSQVMVDTVERFQGSEREVILLSLAIHHRGQVQALSSPGFYEGVEVDRKLNVALSRARSQVIVLGDPRPLQWSSHYKALMAHIQTKGGYISSTFARNCFLP